MTTREQIVAAARGYLNTPYHHQGRVKGITGGVDCIGLLVGAATDAGIKLEDFAEYSRFPDGVTLVRELRSANFTEIPSEEALPGDVLVFWITKPSKPCHVAILSGGGRVIHTWATSDAVVEHNLNSNWSARISHAFRFPGVLE